MSPRFVQCRQGLDDLHRLHADPHYALEEGDDVAGIVGPRVRVIPDAAALIDGDLIALHDPFDGRLAVDRVVVSLQRDVAQDQVGL